MKREEAEEVELEWRGPVGRERVVESRDWETVALRGTNCYDKGERR